MNKIFRYPGTKSYTQDQEDIFYGRADDIDNIFRSMLLNACTVILGKSGIGKSSVINAGLIPKIDKEINQNKDNNTTYRYLRIRLGPWEKKEDDVLEDKLNSIDSLSADTASGFIPAFDESIQKTIWYKLKQKQYRAQSEKRAETFVLIIDQLEEIFTYPGRQVKDFLYRLSDLLSSNIPDHIREALGSIRKQGSSMVSEQELSVLYSTLPVKFIFAIRSDRLNLVTRLKKVMPNILQNTYELLPLSKKGAEDAIRKPAEKADEKFVSQPFVFTDEAILHITGFLGFQSDETEWLYEDKSIEPFNLQMICANIEKKVIRHEYANIITEENLGDLKNIIEEYFTETMLTLFPEEAERNAVVQAIKEKLIDKEKKFRKMILSSDTGIAEENLKKLYNAGLLRIEMQSQERVYYELSHDRLVEVVMANEKKSTENENTSSLQKIDDSLKQLQDKLANNPDDYTLLKQMGDYYFFRQEYAKAIEQYTIGIEKATRLNAPVIDLYKSRADSYFYLNDYAASNDDYKQILAVDPQNLLANFYTGYNFYNIAAYAEAEPYFKKVVEIDDKYIYAYYNLGLIAENQQDTAKAILMYQKVIELDATYKKALLRLGGIYFKSKQYDEAEKYFSDTIALDPQSNDAYYNIGLIHYNQGHSDKAILNFKKALEINSKDADACYYLGILNTDAGEFEKGVYYLERSTEINPGNANAYNEIGVSYFNNLHDNDKALENYLLAIKANPAFAMAYYNTGLLKNKTGNNEEAAQYFEKAIELNSDYKESYLQLSTSYKSLYKYDLSAAILEEYIQRFGDDARVYNRIGVNYYNLGNDLKAIDYYNKAIAIDTTFVDAYYNLGLSYKRLGQVQQAIQYFEKVLELNATDYEALYSLGELYELQDEKATAENKYRAAIRIKPDYKDAITKLEALLNGGK